MAEALPKLEISKDDEKELQKIADELEAMVDETSYSEEQPLSRGQEALLNRIYDRLELFQQGNEPYHEAAKKARQILHMDDPDQDTSKSKKVSGKKTLQLQTLKSTVNNVIADQMLSMPEARLLPETALMQEAADDLQDMVHYVIYCANDFEQTHYRLCEDFYGPGTMVAQTAWDPDMNHGKGEIAIIRWPIEAFLWDPKAENIQDCRAVMKLSWHPLSWFRSHYPEQGRYVGAEKGSHENVGMTTAQEAVEDAGSDEDRALLIEYWWRDYDAKTRRYKINVAYAAGNALLDVQLGVYDHGLYPFSILPCDTIEGCLAGEGLVTQLAPMMRYINRYMAYVDMNLRMASKTRALVRKDAGIDIEALADWENDIIEGNNITPDNIQWMSTPPFNSMINQMMLQLETDLKQDSGANQFTRGETTGGIVSGKAINSLIQAGGKISSMRTEQIKYFFKDIVEQIIWLMAQFYDDKRVMMITGRKGVTRELMVNHERLFGKSKGAVNPPPYTVQIEISSRDPQRIANQNQMFMEAYTMSAQAQQFFPLSSLIEILNLDGKDKILPIIKGNEAYQQQMQQMQMQLEQANQQMQQMAEENQHLKQTTMQMGDALSSVKARLGQTPGEEPEESAMVGQAENNFGQQTGMPLPT